MPNTYNLKVWLYPSGHPVNVPQCENRPRHGVGGDDLLDGVALLGVAHMLAHPSVNHSRFMECLQLLVYGGQEWATLLQ